MHFAQVYNGALSESKKRDGQQRNMQPLSDLLEYSSSLHGHLCSGQVLGVRMAMAGCREIGIEEPRGSKKLFVYAEIDRCATDAIQAVTGCSLGKRTLKFLDYGKMAASFINLETQRAVRVLAKEEARSLVSSYVSDIPNRREAEKTAYSKMPEEALLCIHPIKIQIPREDLPGIRGERRFCERCGEGINSRREIQINGQILCVPCAQGSYLPQAKRQEPKPHLPRVILVTGRKNSGKTVLIEKLIPELSQRGYRVGTIKHHHSRSPIQMDHEGKDSWRHRRAGADAVAVVSPSEVVLIRDANGGSPLDEVVAILKGVDIVLVVGFHTEPRTKIEIRRTLDHGISTHDSENHLLALVTSDGLASEAPSFRPQEIKTLANLIERQILSSPQTMAKQDVNFNSKPIRHGQILVNPF